jgi:integrase
MRFLEPEEVAVLVKTIEEHYRPMVLTAAYVGLRWGELIGLAVENVDLDRCRIRVERQISEVHGKLVFGPPKTKAGVRTVTIPRSLCEILEPHLKTWAVQTSGLAFPGPKGGPLRAPSFRKVWRRACLRAGLDEGALEGLVFHELRHTAAARNAQVRTLWPSRSDWVTRASRRPWIATAACSPDWTRRRRGWTLSSAFD